MRKRLALTLGLVLAFFLTPVLNAQPFGGWLNLDGTTGYIEVPTNSALNPSTGFTFEAWVRINAEEPGCRSLAGKGWTQSWWVGICGTTMRSYLHGATSDFTSGTIPTGVWTHIAVTWDGAIRHHYINGSETGILAEGASPEISDSDLRIGNDVSWNFTPTASMDEVNLWNVPRFQSEIQADMAGPITGPVHGLVAVWSFNGNGRDTVAVYNGSVEGTAAFGAPAPPAGGWLTTDELPGFRMKVRIAGTTTGVQESDCVGETLCVSGAVPGRSEVFVRIVGPRPNGYLWPNVVKFTTSQVEVWIEQISSGEVQYYFLAGPWPGLDDLPGLYDRRGFLP